MIEHKAIFALNPSVVVIRGEDAFDSDNVRIEYDRAAAISWKDPEAYRIKRAAEYPPITDYLDGIVKGDQAQVDKYIADCLSVKDKYPKGAQA